MFRSSHDLSFKSEQPQILRQSRRLSLQESPIGRHSMVYDSFSRNSINQQLGSALGILHTSNVNLLSPSSLNGLSMSSRRSRVDVTKIKQEMEDVDTVLRERARQLYQEDYIYNTNVTRIFEVQNQIQQHQRLIEKVERHIKAIIKQFTLQVTQRLLWIYEPSQVLLEVCACFLDILKFEDCSWYFLCNAINKTFHAILRRMKQVKVREISREKKQELVQFYRSSNSISKTISKESHRAGVTILEFLNSIGELKILIDRLDILYQILKELRNKPKLEEPKPVEAKLPEPEPIIIEEQEQQPQQVSEVKYSVKEEDEVKIEESYRRVETPPLLVPQASQVRWIEYQPIVEEVTYELDTNRVHRVIPRDYNGSHYNRVKRTVIVQPNGGARVWKRGAQKVKEFRFETKEGVFRERITREVKRKELDGSHYHRMGYMKRRHSNPANFQTSKPRERSWFCGLNF